MKEDKTSETVVEAQEAPIESAAAKQTETIVEKTAEVEEEVKSETTAEETAEVAKEAQPETVAQENIQPVTNKKSEFSNKTLTKPVTKKQPEPVFIKKYSVQLNQKWQAQYEAVVGLSHRKSNPPVPCQDTAFATAGKRPIVISADGAGSSVMSDFGSQAAVTGVYRLIDTMEWHLAKLLDTPEYEETEIRRFSLIVVKHVKGLLSDLSTQHRRPLRDFRCTLLLAMMGKCRTLWLKVGDGALVAELAEPTDSGIELKLVTLGEVGKGEFANFTTFIDENVQPDDVQCGCIESSNITALMSMSDGAAEKFVSNDGSKIAKRLSEWAEKLRQNNLPRAHLTTAFYAEDFRKGHTGDDCSIALISCGYEEKVTLVEVKN